MNKKICLLIIIIAVLITGGLKAVQALSDTDLQQRRAELTNKIKEAGKTLESISVDLTENLQQISKLDEEIYQYENQIETISNNLQQIEKQINQTENYLQDIEGEYAHQKDALQKRLVYWYETGKTRYLDVLLNSKSIVDFITNYYLVAEIVQYDKDLLDKIEKEKNEIEQIEASLEASKQNLKVIKAEQKRTEILLENSKVVRISYINNLSTEEQRIQEEIDLYQEELDLIELEILLTSLKDSNSQYIGGTFAWPTPGYYTITSSYGMRLHPILKTYRIHTGMDIGAPLGSYTIAANDGIITKATYSYSYGNMVMVDHGGGVTTLYAHGSEILVEVGDVVKRGDAIMKVGSTGWSTGPHLHFEIRINGQTIDPYSYVITNSEMN